MISEDTIIREASDYVKDLFAGNSDGHGADHTMRVYRNAQKIMEAYPEADDFVVSLSALLHDADDHKLFNTENNLNARHFIPDSFGVMLLILPAAIDILTLILQYLVEQAVKNGAKIRNFYDAKVLGICDSYSSFKEREIWEKANTIVNANKKDYDYQSTHNGKHIPPGLKDWYVFPKTYSTPEEAIFECQRQNYWWTDKLYQKRIHYYIIAAIIFTIISAIGIHFSPLKTILSLIGLAVKLCADIRGSLQCSHIMQSIKTITGLPSEAINPSVLESLQEKIKKRREIQILEINKLHSKNAYNWSDLYEETTAGNNSH